MIQIDLRLDLLMTLAWAIVQELIQGRCSWELHLDVTWVTPGEEEGVANSDVFSRPY